MVVSEASEAETKACEAEARAPTAEAEAANAQEKVSAAEAEIAFLKLAIEKLRREFFGSRSERKQRLLDQLELQLDEPEVSATEDELAAEKAAAETTQVKGFTRRRTGRKPLPAHLPRERVVVPGPTSCACCGSEKLSKIGQDITEALCWSHGRRKFYELADIAAGKRRGKRAPPISPLALEAVTRIDALFDIERAINGETADRRLAVRRERSAPLIAELEEWMRAERARLSRHADVAKAMDYMLKRWDGFARFLGDGRICLTNNAAERALRPLCLGRKSWLFAGSDRGGERAAAMYTLIGTAKLNDVDPQAWLADVLARIAEQPQTRLHELLPWHWKAERQQALAA